MPSTLSNTQYFLLRKYQCISSIYVLNINKMLTNDIVNFHQPAPGFLEKILIFPEKNCTVLTFQTQYTSYLDVAV